MIRSLFVSTHWIFKVTYLLDTGCTAILRIAARARNGVSGYISASHHHKSIALKPLSCILPNRVHLTLLPHPD